MSSDARWTDVAVGEYHICGIKNIASGNRLFCMGWNFNGQIGLPRIKVNGEKYITENFYPVMTLMGSTTDWKKLTAAGDHTCGIYGTGDLKCWGANRYGVLAQNSLNPADFNNYWVYDDLDTQGAGNTVRRVLESTSTPVVATWIKVSTYDYHTCAIKADNTLWCWGRNDSDRLGLAASTPTLTHKQFVTAVLPPIGFNPTTDAWIEVSAGREHTCAISVTRDATTIPDKGKLWCWGGNKFKESGQKSGSVINLPNALPVGSNNNWTKVTSGRNQTCAVNDLGSAFCFGYNAAVAFTDNNYSVTAVAGQNENWTSIVTGYNHGCGVKTISDSGQKTSNLYCWGQQQFGQLGSEFFYNSYIPNKILNDDKPLVEPFVWKKLAAGSFHSCAIKNDNSLWCWGKNYWGQLGLGNEIPSSVIKQVSTTNDWSEVKSYHKTSCARKMNNTLWCWGQNSNGQLGDGTTSFSNSPVQTAGTAIENDWDSVAVGKFFSCGLKTDKTLWCWGDNLYGQLGLAGSATAVTGKKKITRLWQSGKIFLGYRAACALEEGTGDLYCWGRNQYQRIQNNTTASFHLPTKIPVPEAGTKWISAKVGKKYICAIAGTNSTTEGSLWCWGNNLFGTLGNKQHYDNIGVGTPAGLRYIPVTSKFNVNTPGTPVGTKTNWKQVSTHDESVCAIKSDGILWCWGYNTNGELGTGNRVESAAPIQVASGSNKWVNVKNGRYHTCGLQSGIGKAGNSLWCWGGRSFERQIGDLNLVDFQPKLIQ